MSTGTGDMASDALPADAPPDEKLIISFGDIPVALEYADFHRLRPRDVQSLLEEHSAPPAVWREVAVIYYRLGLYDEFERFLSHVVETAGEDKVPPVAEDPRFVELYGRLPIQQAECCATLSAYRLYKAQLCERLFSLNKPVTGQGATAGSPSQATSPKGTGLQGHDAEASLRSAEDTLKKADVILNAFAHSENASGPGVTVGGRGAQLAAAARLMLSTTGTRTPAHGTPGSARGGSAPGATQGQSQRKFHESLPKRRAQALSPLVCFGFLHLCHVNVVDEEGQRQAALLRAINAFKAALQHYPESILGRLGLASAYLASKNYAAALRLYANVLLLSPDCPPEVRLAMGICHYHLGSLDRAEACFERCLQLKPDLVDAKVALVIARLATALITTSETGNLSLIGKAFRYAGEVFEQIWNTPDGQNNELLLIHLANTAFWAGDSERQELLLGRLDRHNRTRSIAALVHFLRGRDKHMNGDMHGAAADYQAALNLDSSSLVAARLYLAQASLASGNDREAVKQLQSLLRLEVDDSEVLKLVAYSGYRNGVEALSAAEAAPPSAEKPFDTIARKEKIAAEALNVVVSRDPLDKEALLMNIQLEETALARGQTKGLDNLRRLYYYLQGLQPDVNVEEKAPVVVGDLPAVLHNNFAITLSMSGRFTEAAAHFEKAQKLVSTALQEISNAPPRELLTLKAEMANISFNQALMLELSGQIDAADKAYKKLHADCPGFLDPLLRSVWLKLKRNDVHAARHRLDKAVQPSQQMQPEVFCLLAEIYRKQRRFDKAIKILKQAVSVSKKNDSVVRTLLAIAYHTYATNVTDNHGVPRPTVDIIGTPQVALQQAARFYREALKCNGSNWYAANGVAVLLAQGGYSTAAVEAFSGLLESSQSGPNETTNNLSAGKDNVPPSSPAARSPATQNLYAMRAIVHQNLALLYTGLAFEDSNVVAGKDVSGIDQVKVAKALKHSLAALELQPDSYVVRLQLAQLLFDVCRFHEAQQILQGAAIKFPNDPLVRYKLVLTSERCIAATLEQIEKNTAITTPEAMESLMNQCRSIAEVCAALAEQKRTGANSSKDQLFTDTTTSEAAIEPLEVLGPQQTDQSSRLLAVAPSTTSSSQLVSGRSVSAALSQIPSSGEIEALSQKVTSDFLVRLQAIAPKVQEEFEKRKAEAHAVEELKSAVEQQRLEKEAALKSQLSLEQKSLVEADEKLRLEAEDIAASLPTRGSREKGRGRQSQFDKDFVVEGVVYDGEVDDDSFLDDEDEDGKNAERRKRKRRRRLRERRRQQREKRGRHEDQRDRGESEGSTKHQGEHEPREDREEFKDGSDDSAERDNREIETSAGFSKDTTVTEEPAELTEGPAGELAAELAGEHSGELAGELVEKPHELHAEPQHEEPHFNES